MLTDRTFELLKKYKNTRPVDLKDKDLIDSLVKCRNYIAYEWWEETEEGPRPTARLTRWGLEEFWQEDLRRKPVKRFFYGVLYRAVNTLFG